ncbi:MULTISPECIES: hypothetical protein [Clostridia]|uniref:hypothetical protein n=1 Tax=Clostridium sp. CCUG 7971 TaxID=2811414 RepID=UPI001ABA83F4|nr:hypothetical protein [Clostridium sp. CCUG 7971]MBO3445983.1 hypothetical protein [Clostridium sp. CCUG 7971]
MNSKTKEITLIALLSIIIAISGTFKLPGLIPGTEFQMSAPIAIGICATFGFKKYITSGIIASFINLIMGTHTILNVVVAMVFRIIAGGIISYLGTGILIISLAGPIGTIVGRIVMHFIVGTPLKALIIAAFPGMVYTLLSSYFIYKVIKNIVKKTPYNNYLNYMEMG